MFKQIISRKIKKLIKQLFFKEKFKSSAIYWQNRYKKGGNSGTGSYNLLAEFKAEVINNFIKQNNIDTVVEFGCGDGNQLKYYALNKYTGYDVSIESINICKKIFENDLTKKFKLITDYSIEGFDLAMSIDVIYHLIEDDVFDDYMKKLFNINNKYVIIYSSNTNINPKKRCPHVLERKFTDWIEKQNIPYVLEQFIPNKYPYNGDEINSSISDFYIYKRV